MSKIEKHLLFYSNYCQFCKEIVDLVDKLRTRSLYLMICVDNNRTNIPKFVDCVPLIYTTDKRILKDEFVFEFVNYKKTDLSNNNTDFPVPLDSRNKKCDFSNSYSFVDDLEVDSNNKANMESQSSHMFRNQSIQQNTHHIIASHSGRSDQNDPTQKTMENLMSERDSDLQMFKTIMTSSPANA